MAHPETVLVWQRLGNSRVAPCRAQLVAILKLDRLLHGIAVYFYRETFYNVCVFLSNCVSVKIKYFELYSWNFIYYI